MMMFVDAVASLLTKLMMEVAREERNKITSYEAERRGKGKIHKNTVMVTSMEKRIEGKKERFLLHLSSFPFHLENDDDRIQL